jgi:diaminopimelate epimerase
MDYRNADGSLAEMCGNGIRVYARYLVDAGLAAPGEWPIATRAGLRTVSVGAAGDVSVDMGAPEILGEGAAVIAGRTRSGLRVSLGNPHLACVVDERVDGSVDGLDLSAPPLVDPATFPDGVNVELYQPVRAAGARAITMRVYERGSGETRSCGTGAIAAAVAAAVAAAPPTGSAPAGAAASGRRPPAGEWTVAVPGGIVTVIFDDETSHLRGPAVLVAEGEIRLDLLPFPRGR